MKFSQIDDKFSYFIHEIRTSIMYSNSSKVTIKLLNNVYIKKVTGQTRLPLVAICTSDLCMCSPEHVSERFFLFDQNVVRSLC